MRVIKCTQVGAFGLPVSNAHSPDLIMPYYHPHSSAQTELPMLEGIGAWVRSYAPGLALDAHGQSRVPILPATISLPLGVKAH